MSNPSPPLTAVPYEPSMEKADDNEAATNAGLIETITRIQTKVFQDSGQAMRGVHAKSHGVLIGELRVLENLPAVLAQGLFAKRGTYPVIMRFSSIAGDVLDDNVSLPRGLAIKVVGVSGPPLIPLWRHAEGSFVPAAKSIPIRLQRAAI